jgi:hypothetical protein
LLERGYNIQIPTCNQLEKDKIKLKLQTTKTAPRSKQNCEKEENEKYQPKQPLTTIQTGRTRLVTKF